MTGIPDIPILDAKPLPAWLQATGRPFHADMYAMYSSEYGGIVTEPLLMTAPMDDHLVHRGDGVFETLKCTAGRIYCYQEHLDRLFYSAGKIGLTPPFNREEISQRIIATLRAGARRDALVRVIVSRGPGSMGINPYDSPKAGLYILAHKWTPPFMTSHPEGARVVISDLPVKPGLFATIKSCNYLPNALLKKEASDRQADFAINLDENGCIAEGATENIGIITRNHQLLVPGPARILTGTTMKRVMELAASGIREGWLSGLSSDPITLQDATEAPEILIFGTTTNVTAVTLFNGKPVGSGVPGPIYQKLARLLLDDQAADGPQNIHAFA